MSCDGWSVGDRCRARVAFLAREKVMAVGGEAPDVVTQICAGDEGTVQQKFSHLHMLYVLWIRLNKALPVWHDQVHLLDKIL